MKLTKMTTTLAALAISLSPSSGSAKEKSLRDEIGLVATVNLLAGSGPDSIGGMFSLGLGFFKGNEGDSDITYMLNLIAGEGKLESNTGNYQKFGLIGETTFRGLGAYPYFLGVGLGGGYTIRESSGRKKASYHTLISAKAGLIIPITTTDSSICLTAGPSIVSELSYNGGKYVGVNLGLGGCAAKRKLSIK